jgi:hypothetical protein
MTLPEILIILVFLAIINIAMVVGRIWGIDIGLVIGSVPVFCYIAAIAVHDVARWYTGRPRPLPRAIVRRRAS